MTDKEFVLSRYPEAFLCFVCEDSQYRFIAKSITDFVSLTPGNTSLSDDKAWQKSAKLIRKNEKETQKTNPDQD